ncbi:hypothetical protein INS49_000069 [Diaporthe citri]|uniref:uncharacterized protein n=1 Tax=Diaporthe citri TaxID=83186 RepID=UPI001C7E7476|nr:uncharacterized protein INS49_000069 [Diaporthe citri]KAG6365893.1 hypothetical protein INS49_000069 [Diaporthe citri]
MTRYTPPQTSAVPGPSSIFMPPTSSTSSAGPARRPTATTAEPTPLPNRPPAGEEQQQHGQADSGRRDDHDDDHTFPLPKLRLHIQDATHPGASRFLAAVDASALLSRSVQTVLRLLYVSPHHHKAHDDDADENDTAATPEQLQRPATTTTHRRPARPHYTPPPTRSVTLILEDMPGVAYTKGTDLDGDHKEIHLSLGYVKGIRRAPAGPTTAITGGHGGDVAGAYEIEGVLVHELVHCYQYNGRGECPGGLVEGVADWVRLEARLGAPHWSKDTVPDRWDQGYERTAYFLAWLEGKFGKGTVRRMNEALRVREYKQPEFWAGLFGHDVDALWKEYLRTLKKDDDDGQG